ncbi:Pleckstrin-like proteiny-like domain family B member 1 Protein LL5-alpha [Larimichthys crocea]|uniref:Pleckstrin-like proteiny-like domain family B member 1 Protein LL5-alpha n=1 Tax=Larimichthys crocea TaxID=215358 RepID=A0A6G0I9X0_LARCR|nr:Pleckstrin-like proteiny-like domain family B member 1 Protein LL5-alpha [Larimichthys crocea]
MIWLVFVLCKLSQQECPNTTVSVSVHRLPQRPEREPSVHQQRLQNQQHRKEPAGLLVLKASPSSSSSQDLQEHAQWKNGSMKEDSIYENSSSFQGKNLGNKTPPVPARSTLTNHTPVPHPRTSLSVASSSTSGGQRAQESPKLLRNIRAEARSENSHIPVKFSPTAPSSPRVRGSSLQKRSPSPMRDQNPSHVDVPQRLRTPEPPGTSSLRDLPPLSPYTTHKGTPGSQGFTGKPVPESPQGPRKLMAPSKAEAMRALYAQSPASLAGLEKEPGGWQFKPIPGCSLSGSSPLASPHNQRKTTTGSSKEPGLIKPYTRERKNSISEISDNEDELLEYHRWQREERLREQEMEKLVSENQFDLDAM